jgi:hypothetical protein
LAGFLNAIPYLSGAQTKSRGIRKSPELVAPMNDFLTHSREAGSSAPAQEE